MAQPFTLPCRQNNAWIFFEKVVRNRWKWNTVHSAGMQPIKQMGYASLAG